MSYPYYGRTENRGRWNEDRDRWEDDRNREYDRGQHEGSRFDENRWRGRERWEGGSSGQGYYGQRSSGYDDRQWPAQREGRHASYGYQQPYAGSERDERYARGEDFQRRDRDDDRGPLQRFGDRLREGFRRLGRGPKGFKRSDERIAEDVCERIARSAINAEDVEVTVKDGEVTLAGFVEVRYDKRILEDIADDVFGVSEVHNQLRVQPQSSSERTQSAAQTNKTTSNQGRVTHS
jgi:predicted amino acid-binding ACT domain protein